MKERLVGPEAGKGGKAETLKTGTLNEGRVIANSRQTGKTTNRLGVFEIDEQGGFEVCEVQVAQHLGDVAIVETVNPVSLNKKGRALINYWIPPDKQAAQLPENRCSKESWHAPLFPFADRLYIVISSLGEKANS